MKLSTSTVLASFRPDGSQFSLTESLRREHEAGFVNFDVNFWDWSIPGRESPFLSDKWKEWALDVRRYADRIGVQISQGHAYTYHYLDKSLGSAEVKLHETLVRRSVECCGIFGVKNCVMHPDTIYEGEDRKKRSMEMNVEYLSRLAEDMEQYGMNLAVENMVETPPGEYRFGSSAGELKKLVRLINRKNVGICWDFEHGKIMGLNQAEMIEMIGRDLLATHVSDTFSSTDTTKMHVLPLLSDIEWEPIIKALNKIQYEGLFSYEISHYTERFPDEILPVALKLAYEIGQYLINLQE